MPELNRAKPSCTTEVLIQHKLDPREYRSCGINENPNKSLGCAYWHLCNWHGHHPKLKDVDGPANKGVRVIKANGNLREVTLACFEAVPRLYEMEGNPEGTYYEVVAEEGELITVSGTKPVVQEAGQNPTHIDDPHEEAVPVYPRLGEAKNLGQESRRHALREKVQKEHHQKIKEQRLGLSDEPTQAKTK